MELAKGLAKFEEFEQQAGLGADLPGIGGKGNATSSLNHGNRIGESSG
jgi:hypothetical protein